MKLCVYGGQYGSEGKGSFAEFLSKQGRHRDRDGKVDRKLVVFGENSPNSGHTCSLGKTRNIPACSYFADAVVLGPDSAVDLAVLLHDLQQIRNKDVKVPRVYIHEHAAIVCDMHRDIEAADGIVSSISSTGSGSGAARTAKQYYRREDSTIKSRSIQVFADNQFEVSILPRFAYLEFIRSVTYEDCLFECSQGTLLDVNFGIHPYVTSRQTLPRVAIERNGLGTLAWAYAGVYRTYPIRTGGPSGPTGGEEIQFADLGVENEIATVTKRVRRIFKFSREDFQLSINLTRPELLAFTHLDYIPANPEQLDEFKSWYTEAVQNTPIGYWLDGLFLSDGIGRFVNHQTFQL